MNYVGHLKLKCMAIRNGHLKLALEIAMYGHLLLNMQALQLLFSISYFLWRMFNYGGGGGGGVL